MTVILMTTGILGERMLETILFPLFYISGILKAPVLERLDLYFVAFWFPIMASTLRANYFVAYKGVALLFHKENKKGFYLIFSIVTLIIAQMISKVIRIKQYRQIFGVAGIGITCFILFSLVFSFINKKGMVEE